jgi:hypothetical protein
MPLTPPPSDAPYAYVVDYRPLDACAPPDCRLKGDELVGWTDSVQPDGRRGAYARIGDPRTELYFRRARLLRPGRRLEFTLPAASGDYEYEGYFAAPPGAGQSGAWSARIEAVLADGRVVLEHDLGGQSKHRIDARGVDEMAGYADYFQHLRLPLPTREQPLTLRIENRGSGTLAVGSPLVLKKVLGRGPRQAFLVVTDSTPEPLMLRMLTGSGDDATEWLSRAVQERGTLFARGASPGFNSATFIRRFFRSGFYETEGEPGLFGQGIDERSPSTPPSPVARLAERGFQTELTVANFLLLPTQTRLGFDGGYHNEQQTGALQHPRALVRRFEQWLGEHPRDDALHVVWFSATHAPFPPGRSAPPFELTAPGLAYSEEVLDDTWRNLLETVDRWRELTDAAAAHAPHGKRIWLWTTDHGRVFTTRSFVQPVWFPPDMLVTDGVKHCSVASFEEAHTPFAVLYEGVPRPTPARVDEPTSALAVWRVIERVFDEPLELPNTSTFDTAALPPVPGRDAARWEEGLVVSAGDSGSLRAVTGGWALRSLLIRPQVAPLFEHDAAVQRALSGSPHRGDYFLAEELYDRDADPFEQRNVADENEAVVLEFRRKLADWLAVYHDPPDHPRYEYALQFPREVALTLSAPERVRVSTDGAPPEAAAERVALRGARFVIHADTGASIVDLEGSALGSELIGWVRCAATGLPLARLDGARVRLNLAVARTNCTSAADGPELAAGDVGFRAEQVSASPSGSRGVLTHELVDGLRSWGYARDLDPAREAGAR